MSQAQKSLTLAEIQAQLEATNEVVAALVLKVTALETAAKTTAKSEKEMTDDDARSVLTGETSTLKHNEAAKKLGLSYGQVYSCRGEYTFRHIHKEMKEKGIANPWKK